MITKCAKFCLVLATVFAGLPAEAANCREIRKIVTDGQRETSPLSIETLTVIKTLRDEKQTFYVHAVWPFSPAHLHDAVWDYKKFPEFIPGIEHSRILARETSRVWVYQRLNFPPPFKDRHYVMVSNRQASKHKPKHFRIDWSLSTRFFPPDADLSAVVPEEFSGCWDIRPSGNTGVDAIYAVTLKPGGFIPDWSARPAIKHYLNKLMTALQQRLQAGSALGQ